MKTVLSWHLLPIVLLRHSIAEGRRFSWKTDDGEVVYDPRDFSYWGA